MFKNEYTNQINNIKCDKYIKEKVLKKIQKNNTSNLKKSKIIFRLSYAMVACLILVSSVFVLKNINFINNKSTGNFKQTNYDEVYNILNRFKNSNKNETEIMVDEETGTIPTTGNSNKSSVNGSMNSGKQDHSETTEQVSGVNESDIVKTDGEYIYSLSNTNNKVRIFKTDNGNVTQLNTIDTNISQFVGCMYLAKDRLVVIGGNPNGNNCIIKVYNVTNPSSITEIPQSSQSGYYSDSRMIDNKLYLISNYTVNLSGMEKDNPETYVPYVYNKENKIATKPECINICDSTSVPSYTVISCYDVTNNILIDTKSSLGCNSTIYCSKNNILINTFENNYTNVVRYSINKGKVELKAQGKISGNLLNQFSVDEYNNTFRFVTTVYKYKNISESNNSKSSTTTASKKIYSNITNCLTILDEDLKQTGIIENISPDERVYSVNFMENIAYFVTFRNTDPLFSVDMTDIKNPKIIGSLKIPGFSNYLFPFGNGKLLGIGKNADESNGKTSDIKLSVFNINNPANVTEQFKTNIGYTYSEGLYNHKSNLVDYKKNLIGFGIVNQNGQTNYLIYTLKNNGFEKLADIPFATDEIFTRGIYIGDWFYIVGEKQVVVLDLNCFNIKDRITIK